MVSPPNMEDDDEKEEGGAKEVEEVEEVPKPKLLPLSCSKPNDGVEETDDEPKLFPPAPENPP